jgi:hypothetical protein
VVLEAAALSPPTGHVVGEVLAGAAGTRGLLLEALAERCPVVSVPVSSAVAARAPRVSAQVKELPHVAGTLGELPVAALVRGPPVPVVEPLAVLLLLALPVQKTGQEQTGV